MKVVLDFNDIKYIDYHQASINLDACFILAYFDFNDDRGDRVAEILNKWSKDKVKNLVYHFDYFATLDSDFEQSYYSNNESQIEVNILKIA